MSEINIPDTVKQLVRELDPIVGYDVYADCNCGGEGCGPEVEEVRLADLYTMGYTDDTIAESHWGNEVLYLWEAVAALAAAPQVVDVIQFELVTPKIMANQAALWGDEDE